VCEYGIVNRQSFLASDLFLVSCDEQMLAKPIHPFSIDPLCDNTSFIVHGVLNYATAIFVCQACLT